MVKLNNDYAYNLKQLQNIICAYTGKTIDNELIEDCYKEIELLFIKKEMKEW